MSEGGILQPNIEVYRSRIDSARDYGNVWEIVKDSVKNSLGEYRVGMMLFLDDLPPQLGAYHSLGTNNIVLNRTLVQIVEVTTEKKGFVNAFIYSLLLHEYLHALGHISETEVRRLVYRVSKECFGEDHIAATLADKSPWALLKGFPLSELEVSRQVMEVVRNFEKPDQKYIA